MAGELSIMYPDLLLTLILQFPAVHTQEVVHVLTQETDTDSLERLHHDGT